MQGTRARILRTELEAGRRILVVSDIHGNLAYFTGLLSAAGFNERDILVIDGDFVEKGEHSLETLRLVMELSERGNVLTVCGNCDGWSNIFRMTPEQDAVSIRYLKSRRTGLIREMCETLGIDLDAAETLRPYKEQLYRAFKPEFDFLASLPHAIETEHYIFVHGGVRAPKTLDEHEADELTKYDSFLTRGHRFDKWVIVGHWPVMLYLRDRVCANPIIDRESRIISIDGGCVLKDDGQLNALVIPHAGSEDFSFVAYDPFPTVRARDYQAEGEHSYYIRWGDNKVRVLSRGEEFSRCRHVRTGYEMDILTRYLYGDGELVTCNDCTDYVPEVFPGDELRVVERTSRGLFVKRGGTSGWYFGRVE